MKAGHTFRLPPARHFGDLSERQAQVAELLYAGMTARQISGKLGIRLATAREYTKTVYRRTGSHNRAELVKWVAAAMRKHG